eukprot:scaffold319_cov244-Pinguiococcus_pyrenoidosus.AAC.16
MGQTEDHCQHAHRQRDDGGIEAAEKRRDLPVSYLTIQGPHHSPRCANLKGSKGTECRLAPQHGSIAFREYGECQHDRVVLVDPAP